MPRSVLGLDVGGANLKAAHSGGAARSQPFALWKNPAGLADELRALLGSLPPADALAVTMTGELCDCFENKRQGVHAILDAVEKAAGNLPVHVWQTTGRFVDPTEAREKYLLTAAANWLALATFAGRYAPAGPALLIDVGSTTTDVVPLHGGRPVPRGRTDPERLLYQELVYSGVRRTPLCALLGVEAAAELFATTLDAYLVLGWLKEDSDDQGTADGRPATKAAAHARLARMLCADLDTSSDRQREQLAERVFEVQKQLVASALGQVAGRFPSPPQTAVVAGSGEFLAEWALLRQKFSQCRKVFLSQKLGDEISQAACAFAVAVLATEGA